jgi:hypothetical protein
VPAIGEATVVARNPAVPTVPLGEGIVVMSLEQGRYLELDAIGRAIWQRIDPPCTLAELVDGLAAAYDAPRATILADVKTWLSRLAEAEIVRLI